MVCKIQIFISYPKRDVNLKFPQLLLILISNKSQIVICKSIANLLDVTFELSDA